MGATLALPFLDAMVPAATALSKTAAQPAPRFGAVFVPMGERPSHWTPPTAGAGFEFSPILKPIERFRESLVVVSNLDRPPGGTHAVSTSTWLTGAAPKRTEAEDFYAGISLDQVAAGLIGKDTVFPSIEIATEDQAGYIGACDVGYSCAYMSSIAWQGPTTPLPMEINPRVVFDRMFGDGATADERRRRIATQKSILDAVTDQVRRLQGGLGASDRNRVGDYLDTVREIERRIAFSEKQANENLDVPVTPAGIPDDFVAHTKLMFDLMTIAFQADITRVSTFMMAREVSYRTFPMLGVSEAFHPASHHQNNPERLAQLTRIQTFHVGLWSYWLEKLRATPDGDGNLLDHSLLLYGGAMSNSNVHNHAPLPIVVAGGANGTMKGGRHLKDKEDTPMANLLLTVLNKAGIPQESVGDSTGPLTEL
jgi:hypothetical protein